MSGMIGTATAFMADHQARACKDSIAPLLCFVSPGFAGAEKVVKALKAKDRNERRRIVQDTVKDLQDSAKAVGLSNEDTKRQIQSVISNRKELGLNKVAKNLNVPVVAGTLLRGISK